MLAKYAGTGRPTPRSPALSKQEPSLQRLDVSFIARTSPDGRHWTHKT